MFRLQRNADACRQIERFSKVIEGAAQRGGSIGQGGAFLRDMRLMGEIATLFFRVLRERTLGLHCSIGAG